MKNMKRCLSFALSVLLAATAMPLAALAESDLFEPIIAIQDEAFPETADMQLMTIIDNTAPEASDDDEQELSDGSIASLLTEDARPAAYALAEELGVSIEELADIVGITAEELLAMTAEEIDSLRQTHFAMQTEPVEYAASSGNCGRDVKWAYENNTLTITGSGAMSNYEYSSNRPWDAFEDEIESVVISEGVTSIGKCAFEFCENLQNITIPASINKIGNYAFSYSRKIENVYISDLEAFINIDYVDSSSHPSFYSGKMNLYLNGEPVVDLVIPSSIRKIRSYTFYGCKTLRTLTLHSGMASIGKGAFYKCSNLTDIVIPQCAVQGGFLDGGVWAVYDEAFISNANINVSFAPGVTSFGEDAFKGLTLGSIRIPESCKSIHKTAFENASIGRFYVYENSYGHKFCKSKGYDYSLIRIQEITLPEYEILLDAGTSYTVHPTYFPDYAKNTIKYTTSNKNVAKVSAAGVITAVKAGTATITAKGDSAKAAIKVTVKNAPKKVFIEAEKDVLSLGESIGIHVSYDGTAYGSYTLSSSNTDAITIDEDERLHAVGIGKSTITATAYNNVRGEIDIWVKKEPSTVLLGCSSAELAAGDTMQLEAGFPEDEAGTITFHSLNETIASVDAAGKILGIRGGHAVIRAQAHNGVYSDCLVTVHELRLEADRTVIGLGEKLTVCSSHIPAMETNISYKLSSSKIVSIEASNNSAVLTAKAVGTVKLTATDETGASAVLKIQVRKKPGSLKLTAERNSIGIGEDLQISAVFSKDSAGFVSYSIVEPAECSFASIDAASGLLTTGGTLESTQTVTVQGETYNGKKAVLSIAVTPAPIAIALNAEFIDLWQDDTFTLIPSITEGTSSRIYYRVQEGADLVKVDADGKITAIAGSGRAVVEASTYNRLSARTALVLHAAPQDIAFDLPFTTISVGDTLQIQATISPENGSCECTWSSSNPKIASVSSDGLVSALKPGSAAITLKTYNGVKETIKLTVKKKPTKGSVAVPEKLGFDESVRLLAKGNTGGYAGVIAHEISADSAGIIEITNGMVHAVGRGTARIRVQLYTGAWTPWKEITVLNAPVSDGMGFSIQHIYGGGWHEAAFNSQNFRVAKGDYMNVRYVYADGYAGGYRIYSTNDAVISVNGSKVKFLKEGRASLVFEAYNGASVSIDYDVADLPSSLWLDGASKCTIGFEDDLYICQSVNGHEDLLDFDYMHYSISASGSAVKLIKDPEFGCGYFEYAARRLGSSRITVKLFNGKKLTKAITIARNRANNIEPKPNWRDYNEWELCLKSVEIVSNNKVVCEFYLVNPYSLYNIVSINQHEITIRYDNHNIAEKYFGKIKVNCPRKSVKLFRLTFTGNSIIDTDFDLRGSEESVWFSYFYAG